MSETTQEKRQLLINTEAAEFQETILRSTSAHIHPYVMDINRIEYTIFPNTFNPVYAKAAMLLLDNLGAREGDTVLDPFTGTGIDGLFAVKRYRASHATLADINPWACLTARYNALNLSIDHKVDIYEGPWHEVVPKNKKYSLVVANPPFKEMYADTLLERAIRDEQGDTMKNFFKHIPSRLEDDGRIRIVFSNVGDMDKFYNYCEDTGFKRELIASDMFGAAIDIHVYELTKA
tara:strand:+ start:164 stop:865 length:702 start_codon:yes stop_codon:yes gene_type:complete